METIKKSLLLRKKIKARKRNFVVKESNYIPRVKGRWRNPRGIHSASRQRHRGRPSLVSIGYGGPKLVRHLHSSGLEKTIVHNAKELLAIDPDKQGAIIASSTGKKRKQELLQLARVKKIRILNVKDAEKALEKIKSDFDSRKSFRAKKSREKSKKEEEKRRKAEEKKKEEEKKAEEKKKEGDEKKEVAESERSKETFPENQIEQDQAKRDQTEQNQAEQEK